MGGPLHGQEGRLAHRRRAAAGQPRLHEQSNHTNMEDMPGMNIDGAGGTDKETSSRGDREAAQLHQHGGHAEHEHRRHPS